MNTEMPTLLPILILLLQASMGPCSDEHGNGFTRGDSFTVVVWLQWGRALMNTEMWLVAVSKSVRIALQWGRALMNTEILIAGTSTATIEALQWGRALMNTEIGWHQSGVASQRPRFNGAVL